MKQLKTFDFTKAANRGQGILFLKRKSGVCRLNKQAVAMLCLKAGSRINIHQDEEEPRDWFISIATDKTSGVELRQPGSCQSEGAVLFNSAALVQEIFDAIEYPADAGGILIGKSPEKIDGVTCWPLITAAIKGSQRRKKNA